MTSGLKGKKIVVTGLVVACVAAGMSVAMASCRPVYAPPTKLLPAYNVEISYPSQHGSVTVARGGAVTLPVTMKSLVNEPIRIRPAITASASVPEFLTFGLVEYVSLPAGSTFSTQVTLQVAPDAPAGRYMIGIKGELETSVKERAGAAMMFNLIITEGQS